MDAARIDSQAKLTNWKKEPSLIDLKADLEATQPSHDAHVTQVNKWNELRKIDGKSRPKAIQNRSTVQPKLIRRQNEWRYSALSEPFLSSKKMFDTEPATFEDVDAARQSEMVLNWQFRTKMNSVKFIDDYVRTAVDEGTTIVRLGWKRHVEQVPTKLPVYEFVEANSEEEVQLLQQAIQMKEMNPRGFSELPEELQAAAEYSMENGVPVSANIVGMEDGFEEVIRENHPTLDIIDPDNFFIDPSANGDPDNAGFIVVSFETSKAELKKDGRYKNLDKVNWSGAEILAQPDHKTEIPDNFNFKDELRKRIVAYEYWGFHDIEGNDKLVPIVATWVGDTLIRMEENPFPDEKPPFVLVPYLPVRKSVMGEPDAEILEDNQKVLGAVTRGMIDLMGRSANSQQALPKGFVDVTNRRRLDKGLDYEYNPSAGVPQTAIYQHTYPEIPNSAIMMLNLQNQEAEAITGVKSFHGGISGEAYGEVAAGIKGMLDAAAKREMNILRRLAKGISQIGTKMAAMNAVFLSEEEVVRVTNEKWVKIKREDLKGNFDVIVDISTAEVDMAKSQDLGFMLQTMGPDMDPAMSKMILGEIAELKRMPALAHSIRTYEPQPDPLMERKKELEIAKLEAEIAEIQSRTAENQAQAANYQAEADKKTLEFVEQETGTKHARELEKVSEQGRSNQALEVTKALTRDEKPEMRKPDLLPAVAFNALTDQTRSTR